MNELERIVRDLASTEPLVLVPSDFGDDHQCGLCDELIYEHLPHGGHGGYCLWRRAQEWVDGAG